jgi:hypothetical protein
VIDANLLSHRDDVRDAAACIELGCEIGTAAAPRPYAQCKVAPGCLKFTELASLVREAVVVCWHQTCTVEKGRNILSVGDIDLRAFRVQRLWTIVAAIVRERPRAPKWRSLPSAVNAPANICTLSTRPVQCSALGLWHRGSVPSIGIAYPPSGGTIKGLVRALSGRMDQPASRLTGVAPARGGIPAAGSARFGRVYGTDTGPHGSRCPLLNPPSVGSSPTGGTVKNRQFV